jgi:hypothetical protein
MGIILLGVAPKIPSNFNFQKYIQTLIKYPRLVAKIFWDP